ncbi:MAG: TRAP transporter small permease subunit, partial [Sulfitobacter sp.]
MTDNDNKISPQDPVEQHYDPLWEEVENDDRKLPKASAWLDKIVTSFGEVVMWVNVVLVIAIISQVGMRYLFGTSYPKLDELQWHLYALTTMIGVSYALSTDSHVRVDILRLGFSDRAKRVVEILGITVLVLPFCWLMIDQGIDYFNDSYRVNERSDSPIGLPARWLLKSVIPISFVLVTIAALARLIHDVYMLATNADERADRSGLMRLGLLLLAFAAATYGLVQFVETPEEALVIMMFMTFVGLLFAGFPVAWVLAGVGVLYAGIGYLGDNDMLLWTGLESTFTGLDYLTLGTVVNRVYSTMSNAVLVALPMFIFMGLMLDESGVAQRLMNSMQRLFGTMRGGLAITVTAIGIILAASTGIVGASVVLLGLLSMPAMMEQKYSKTLASG